MKRTTFYRPLLNLLWLLIPIFASGQQQYINGPLSTGPISNNGTLAPSGYTWSELQNNTGDLSATNIQPGQYLGSSFKNKFSDDFIVPTNETWSITGFDFYVFYPQWTSSTIPVSALGIEIWNGDPSLTASVKLYGNLTTNSLDLENSGEAMMYHIKNSNFTATTGGATPNLESKMWKIRGSFNASLPAATYWIVFQPVYATYGVVVPLKRIMGSRGYPLNAPGKFLDASPGHNWVNTFDPGVPTSAPDINQDYPFTIHYTTPLSSADFEKSSILKLYPNPVENVLNISSDTNFINQAINKVVILDSRGVIVLQPSGFEKRQHAVQIDISDLHSGLYFVQISNVDGAVFYNGKIVKK